MTRWLPEKFFVDLYALDCMMCQQVRRQLQPRRLERLRRMEEKIEEEEEEESSSVAAASRRSG